MIRLIRSAVAIPLFLISAYTLVSAVWNFITAIIFQHANDAVLGFAFLGATAILVVLVSVINPKPQQNKPTMPTIKTLTIPADHGKALSRDTIDQGLAALQTAVGGYIEPVGNGPDWTAWADEDGKSKGRPFNPRATHAMGFMSGHNLSDPIVGDVVLTGHTPDGMPADLADEVAERAENLSKELTL